MQYYRCFVCGRAMESPDCLLGATEKCPDCGNPNWVPFQSTPGCEKAFRRDQGRGRGVGSPARMLAAVRRWRARRA